MKELVFETKLIEYLSTGRVVENNEVEEDLINFLPSQKKWTYRPDIRTTDALWQNFKEILEQHNQSELSYRPMTVTEFAQVKKVISDLHTPYQAGQFLYGMNGTAQIEIDLDDGKHVYLTVFKQDAVDADDTVYQVVNQIKRPAIVTGKIDRRFDTTLLINGLPIVQIEEKKDTIDVNAALNQMKEYIDEKQYGDIFSTLQILVGITPNNVKYMANTPSERFNKDFAFNWQVKEEDDRGVSRYRTVRQWKEFARRFLSIPMAHQMATSFMILDGTKTKETLKVMRPYQVEATRKVIEALKRTDFELGTNKLGYIWHTTGSGKTITSFKTAWLASRLPNVDKVVFLVDRVNLTNQTRDEYRAYDPEHIEGNIEGESALGSVQDTKNTRALGRRLKDRSSSIIVTSIQKMDTLVKRRSFKSPDKNIVFIVDEAHRSTNGNSFATIQNAFKRAAWVGYTGTPMVEDTAKGTYTQDVFGSCLHSYTIRDAIRDRNVLGFKVDFETTIDQEAMKEKYLPEFYHAQHPDWSNEKIKEKIANLTPEDMDDAVQPSFYDENQDHIQLVVEDVFKNWKNRSNDGKYNALFTTHVGGGKASTPMAMMYFDAFQRKNQELKEQGRTDDYLRVAVTFADSTNHNDHSLESNKGLHRAMMAYNDEFGTKFGMSDVSEYTDDVVDRLKKTADDGKYLDLVIVVDQLLTGFNAPELNTLYVDRTLKNASLIQAYSRTNRVADMDAKPFGRIVNYRWPAQNERLMNEALAIYADEKSADLSDEERKRRNQEDGITAKDFSSTLADVKEVIEELREMTEDFNEIPASEKKCEEMYGLLRSYNAGMTKLKQYQPENGEGFDYSEPDKVLEKLGISSEEEVMLTTVLANQLKAKLAAAKEIPVYQLDLRMSHIKDVRVNYDYLTELIATLLRQVHDKKMEEAQDTQEKIVQFADGLDDRLHAKQIKNAASAIVQGYYPDKNSKLKYPYDLDDSKTVIEEANAVNIDQAILEFRYKWGLTDVVNNAVFKEMLAQHTYGKQDLNDTNLLSNWQKEAVKTYHIMAQDATIKSLSKVKYRNELRAAIYDLADTLVREE